MDGNSFVVMQPFGFPLKTKVDGSSVPSAVIVTAVATCFVLFVSCEIDRCLVHVDDKMSVAIATADDEAHESHEVKGLALNFGRRALRHMHAHSI